MNKEIDLAKFGIRTDLALEDINRNNYKVDQEIYEENSVKVIKVNINDEQGKTIGKKKGKYITLEFNDITDKDNYNQVLNLFIKELKLLINDYQLKDEEEVLIVGLGNEKSTADAIGPQAIKDILVTRHMFLLNSVSKGYQNVCAIAPGVTGQTGIETANIISDLCKDIKPKLVIIIDALASLSHTRLNKTIQITTSGINPGSGIGNNREEISKETIGSEVIAIGVPTVVSSLNIIAEVFDYISKYFSYNIINKDNKINKLKLPGTINYMKEENNLTPQQKEVFLGLLGTLEEDELKELIKEVIEPIGLNLIVATKEIDFIVDKLSSLIANGINSSLHRQVL